MKIAHLVKELETKYAFELQVATDEVNHDSESWIRQKEELFQIHSNAEVVQDTDINFRSDSQLRESKNRDIKLKSNESNEFTKVVTGILIK